MADASAAPLAAHPAPPPSAASPSSRPSSRRTCPGVPLPPNVSTLPTLSRPEVASRIARGELLVLHPPLVYRVPHSWLRLHPGGQHAILHYVGRDASCEIEGYHSGRTVEERMGRWAVGRVDVDESEGGEGWRDMVPPVQLGMWPVPLPTITVTSPPASPAKSAASTTREGLSARRALSTEMVDPPLSKEDYAKLPLTPAYQAHLRRSHRKLHERIRSLGLDTPPPFLSGYGPSLVIYAALALLSICLYRRASSTHATTDWLAAAVALGAFWHQVTFVAHDAGHTGLTGSWWTDRLWGVGIADFLGGLSIGWWCDNHNVHHRASFPFAAAFRQHR